MTMITAFVGSATTESKPARDAGQLVKAFANWVQRRYAIHAHRRILRGLPDHILADIGIERGMIDEIVPTRLDDVGRPKGPYPF